MTPEDPHPWSPIRWLVDALYIGMIEDWPDANRDYLFKHSALTVEENWPSLTKDQQSIYVERSENDKRKSKTGPKSAKKRKSEPTAAEEKSPTATQKKKKAAKDPNKPKNALTSYFIFFNEKREAIKEANPDFSIVDVTKEASRRWKEMSDAEKEPYHREHARQREVYQAKMVEYNKSLETTNKEVED